jgi:hypothetical protein
MRCFCFTLFLIALLGSAGSGQDLFWKAGEEKVGLFIDSSRINVRFSEGVSPELASAELAKVQNIAAVHRCPIRLR